MTVIGPSTGFYAPTHPAFSYTDHAGVTVDGEKARFLRPLSFQTREHYAPGSRVRLRSDADQLTLMFEFNNLYDRSHWNNVISIYVDGAWHSDHDPSDIRAVFAYSISLDFGSSDFRTIEAVLPYCAALDFLGLRQHPRYRLLPCQPRPLDKMLVIGDSISNEFYASRTRNGYAFLLAREKKLQLINMAYANATASTHAGAAYAAVISDVSMALVMLGVNDCAAQVPLVNFKGHYTAILNSLLANTGASRILAVTPIWSIIDGTITLAAYRTAVSEAVAAIADARLQLVDGLPLTDNDTGHVFDGVHPNDDGHAAIAANLASLIT